MTLTAEQASGILNYDPETGVFSWRCRRTKCGSLTKTGYLQIQIAGRLYLAHRLAWLISHGRWPNGDLDHIDRDRINNRLVNLREAARWQNIVNSVSRRHSKTGERNVYVRTYKNSRYYIVRIHNKHVAQFPTFEQARELARALRRTAYGDFNPAKGAA